MGHRTDITVAAVRHWTIETLTLSSSVPNTFHKLFPPCKPVLILDDLQSVHSVDLQPVGFQVF